MKALDFLKALGISDMVVNPYDLPEHRLSLIQIMEKYEEQSRQAAVISSFCQCEKPDWCMESNDCGECGKEIQTKRQNDL